MSVMRSTREKPYLISWEIYIGIHCKKVVPKAAASLTGQESIATPSLLLVDELTL